MRTFAEHCSPVILSLKLRLLDHFVENFNRFVTLSDLNASLFEHYNLHMKYHIGDP